ncbi:putative cyclase [Punctularia strigosozonata HHB-11173 SS5]|uniref:putative cyclase n=1 Tax=Punctularia strigosozonata (strain HHB-11173) TaxID=741275 RepID=UPI0004417764|nr:putative cyclase [Punctularia strigosozonata HHB-11173 SS5]EIN06672.1 putative cyclase [Punctularia strigosozonata HHB-11173 SS5]
MTNDFVDLSHKLNDSVQIYPGDPAFCCKQACTVPKDGYSVHALSMGSHTGTHVDAPSHFVLDGAAIDELPLSLFVGPALVIDVSKAGTLAPKARITWDDLQAYEARMRPGVVVLVHTGWARHWGSPVYFDHPFLTRDAAQGIMRAGVKTVGIDTLSPDETHTGDVPADADWGVHETVLGAEGVIAENLKGLEQLLAGEWTVHVAPLNLTGVDGSPVRAYATRNWIA